MRKNKKSSILIVTVWVLSMLAIFTVYLGRMTNQKILVIAKVNDDQDLHLLAESGMKLAFSKLTQHAQDFNSLNTDCMDNPDIFKDVRVGRGRFSLSYIVKDIQTQQRQEKYGFMDEESRINVNTASSLILSRMFENLAGLDVDAARKLADALIDYRDADTITNEGIDEDFHYASDGKHYRLKNSDFEFPEEIKLVKGMTPGIFEKIVNYITVYGRGLVNINTASPEVLEVMGLPNTLVAKVISFRAGKDAKEGTSDDNIIDDMQKFMNELPNFSSLSDNERNALNDLLFSGAVTTKSSAIRINVIGSLNSGKKNKFVNAMCVWSYGRVRYWKENILTSG